MENRNTDAFLLELEREKNRVVSEHDRTEKIAQEMEQFEADYEGIFSKSSQLFSELENLFQAGQSRYVFKELFSEIKKEEKDIFERIDAEKNVISRKKRELEKREDEICHEKQQTLKDTQ